LKPTVLPDPLLEARELVRRYLFGTFALVFGLNAALLLTNTTLPPSGRTLLLSGSLLMALFSAVIWRRPEWRTEGALVVACAGAMTLLAGAAIVHGWGMNGPVIGFLAVLSFVMGATVSARLGMALGATGMGLLVALAGAEHAGWIRGVAALADMTLQRRLVNLLILVGVGLSSGLMVHRVFAHYLGASREREARFQTLLGIAVDTYWEIDERFTQTHIWYRHSDNRFVPSTHALKAPWDQPEWEYETGMGAVHYADLRAHRPFRDLRVRWRRPDGGVRHLLVSGEPRVDAGGRFRGYWGVTRNIDELAGAQEALRRSETTLSTLVTTSPDMITLTDVATGRFVMVNETFTRLCGYTREEAIGRTSVELGVWSALPSRDAFVRKLREAGRVQDLPVEFVDRWGRPFTLLISATTFELEGKSYMVLNGRDVTESERTRLAHEAVLENASLGIAFTREGRFVQANPALEKMLGWASGTLVGQPGRAVWASDAEYAEIGALIGPPLSQGEPVEFVRELVRRDGSSFWCRMLAKAADPNHPMRGGTIWIVEDITERRRTEQALARARDEAEAASRAKSAFLANTSHEIRTPLNGLVGLARLARRPDLDETRRRQYLEQIAESAETLSAIISDVLDLSKIEAGRLGIEHVAFDLHALLDSLRQVHGTLADARGLCFALHTDPDVPRWVWGDPMRVRQVLVNYLSNALKFTERGSVTLHAGVVGQNGRLRFEVRDTGLGIAPEVRERLFQPFMQADQSTTRRFGGSGLGLSICQELATLMGGQVGVDSTPGQGSCFWAELPLQAAAAPPHDSGFGALEPSPLAGSRVLMVEDNPVNMTIAVAMLEQWGVQVEQAADGRQAIAAVEHAEQTGRPLGAVLMDVQMPVMSGYEATRALRARPGSRHLPIIALTAAALTSERDEALASGMDGFLTKPIDMQKLHDTLMAALSGSS
jgi:PAS domain S-box-containing protein